MEGWSGESLGRESQTVALADRVAAGELTYAQGERLGMYLDLERLGAVASYYPSSVLASRRREARAHGLAANDTGAEPLTVDIGELLAPYQAAIEQASFGLTRGSADAGERSAAAAVGFPAAADSAEVHRPLRIPGVLPPGAYSEFR